MPQNKTKNAIEYVMYQSRWLLLPFYLGLIVAQGFYCLKFVEAVIELCKSFHTITESELMFVILTLIDITMIANLIKMIVVGSYQTFVEKMEIDNNSEKVSSGALKVKMGSSLVGISSIHLLQTFLHAGDMSDRDIIVKCSIHLIFLVSTMGLAYMDYLHHQTKPQSQTH